MKKMILAAGIVACTLSLAGCGSAHFGQAGTPASSVPSIPGIPATQSSSNSQGLLGSLLSGLIGNAVPVSEKSVIGTWHYASPECRFESEDFLTQAGGEVAASQIEQKLGGVFSKVGIGPNTCAFTFAPGNQATMTIAGQTINGTYTVDSKTRKLNFKSQTGLISVTATVYQVGNELTMLYDAQKLLGVVQTVGALGGNMGGTVSTLSQLLGSYKGMQLGMNLHK